MPALMQCHIVSAEAEIYSGRIAMLSATGTLGELGILPGHAALLTGIRPPRRSRMPSAPSPKAPPKWTTASSKRN